MKNCPTCLAKLPKDFTFKDKYKCTRCHMLKPESEFSPMKRALTNPAVRKVFSMCKACNRKRVNAMAAKKLMKEKTVE